MDNTAGRHRLAHGFPLDILDYQSHHPADKVRPAEGVRSFGRLRTCFKERVLV
jgi:hypothetical protein